MARRIAHSHFAFAVTPNRAQPAVAGLRGTTLTSGCAACAGVRPTAACRRARRTKRRLRKRRPAQHSHDPQQAAFYSCAARRFKPETVPCPPQSATSECGRGPGRLVAATLWTPELGCLRVQTSSGTARCARAGERARSAAKLATASGPRHRIQSRIRSAQICNMSLLACMAACVGRFAAPAPEASSMLS